MRNEEKGGIKASARVAYPHQPGTELTKKTRQIKIKIKIKILSKLRGKHR